MERNRELYFKVLNLGTADDPDPLNQLYADIVNLADALSDYSADIFP